jgi:hypothetical protein
VVFRRDAEARIHHGEDHLTVHHAGANRDAPAFRCELHRIGEEVEETPQKWLGVE